MVRRILPVLSSLGLPGTGRHIKWRPPEATCGRTWGPDGHLYAAWGDGGGFGGTNSDARVSMGFARIEGPPESFLALNIGSLWPGNHTITLPRMSDWAVVLKRQRNAL